MAATVTVEDLRNKLEEMIELVDRVKISGPQQEDLNHKIIHLRSNPAQSELDQRERQFEDLKKENERLKARIKLLEAGDAFNVTRQIDATVDSAKKLAEMTNKVEELKRREEKILVSFRKISREFREVVYLLTGYKMDALKDRIYKLTHMYADNPDDKLMFEISEVGEIKLLGSEFSDRQSEYIRTYLQNGDSFPAFLAAITLDLFRNSTQMAQASMSLTMSDTIRPNIR